MLFLLPENDDFYQTKISPKLPGGKDIQVYFYTKIALCTKTLLDTLYVCTQREPRLTVFGFRIQVLTHFSMSSLSDSFAEKL